MLVHTTISRTAKGEVVLTVEGDNDPVSVMQKYLEVEKKIFPHSYTSITDDKERGDETE